MTRECGCPGLAGVVAVDEDRHAAWHALVEQQAGETRRPRIAVERPDRQARTRIYRQLVEDAKRAGRHAAAPDRGSWRR